MLDDTVGKYGIKAFSGKRKEADIANHEIAGGTQLPTNPPGCEDGAERWVNANHTIAKPRRGHRPPPPATPNIKQASTLGRRQSQFRNRILADVPDQMFVENPICRTNHESCDWVDARG
jgi:hypothetical protein